RWRASPAPARPSSCTCPSRPSPTPPIRNWRWGPAESRGRPMTPLRTALIYDFDGTLARGNMQEVSFIPSIGMTPQQFWKETVQPATVAADGDDILMYMQMMLQVAR